MTIYRCRICACPYLGSERPPHCSFCGAHQRHIVPAAEYEPTGVAELSPKSRANLEQVLEWEVENSTFCRGASKVAATREGTALFVARSRIKTEHADIVCRILAMPKPEELCKTGACSPVYRENLLESRRREERAVELHGRFLDEAVEERVREVLEAFIEIETDHLLLSC